VAATKKFVEKTLHMLQPLDVTARPMCGEYGLYVKGKSIGFICDDTPLIKITEAGRQHVGRIALGAPHPAFKISRAIVNDHEWLTRLVELTGEALPAPTKSGVNTAPGAKA
jgi:hypothetical protein